MSRRLAREVALRTLFQLDRRDEERDVDAALRYNAEELVLGDKHYPFAEQLVRGVLEHRESVDAQITQYAVGWTIPRMPRVDRNVLRIAVYEVLHEQETPHGVAVNEAVELAKRYGDAESSRFINGVLGEILRAQGAVTPS